MQESVVTELDRRILNALQVNPRASWTQVGAVVGADPVTVSRRWTRLTDARVAWVTAYAAALGSTALIEIECSGNTLALAQRLAADDACATIDITSGGRDLILTVHTDTADELTDYLLTRLGAMPAIRAIRTHVVTQILTEASRWRLRDLTADQITRLESAPVRSRPVPAPGLTPVDRKVLDALTKDGRMAAADIAAMANISVRKARETVNRLLADGRVALRTEIQRSLSGWPVYAWYFLRMPAAMVQRAAPRLNRLDEVRAIMTTAGQNNMMMAVWMRELTDVARLEAAIEEQLEGVQIADRSIVLRTVKLVGTALDSSGRRVASAASAVPE